MAATREGVTISITRNGMGQAEPALSHQLAATYLELLELESRLPGCICLYAEGVKLACEGSPVLDTLRALAEQSVELLVCSTCLQFFGLEKSLAVGRAGNMKQIQEAQWNATKVIAI
jgi:hypothetical protein